MQFLNYISTDVVRQNQEISFLNIPNSPKQIHIVSVALFKKKKKL